MNYDDNENVDFKYFVKLAMNKKISWNLLISLIDESTPTLEKSKELNKILVEELRKIQSNLEDVQNGEQNVQNNAIPINDFTNEEENNDQGEVVDDSSEVIEMKQSVEEVPGIECIFCDKIFLDFSTFQKHLETHMTKRNKGKPLKNVAQVPNLKQKIEIIFDQNFDFEACDPQNNSDFTDTEKIQQDRDLVSAIEESEKGKSSNNTDHNKDIDSNYDKDQNSVSGNGNLQNPFKCVTCEMTFTRRYNLSRHEKTHFAGKTLKCKICYKRLSEDYLAKHEKNHFAKEEQNLVECDICGKKFTSLALKTHVRNTHNNDSHTFDCEICGRKYTRPASLREHIDINHSAETPKFTCAKCGKRFGRYSIKRRHEKSHLDYKPFECKICLEKFREASHLKHHELIKHSNEKAFQCTVCNKKFKTKSSLKLHKFTHTEEKPFQCNICKMRFKAQIYLKSHKLTHENPLYKCSYCDKSFALKGVLKEHMKSHTEEKNFKCTECNRSFLRNWMLNRHLKAHTTRSSSNA